MTERTFSILTKEYSVSDYNIIWAKNKCFDDIYRSHLITNISIIANSLPISSLLKENVKKKGIFLFDFGMRNGLTPDHLPNIKLNGFLISDSRFL